MQEYSELFVGLDTSKLKISVAVADYQRDGEVRSYGGILAEPASMASMVGKLAKSGAKLRFCYEAGRSCTRAATSVLRQNGRKGLFMRKSIATDHRS